MSLFILELKPNQKKHIYKINSITGKNPICCPQGCIQQCTGKILFKGILIILGQHCIGNNPVQETSYTTLYQ